MLDLSNISLVAIGSTKINETLKAISHCHSLCRFKETIFFTDAIGVPYSHKIQRMNSIKDYDKFVVKELPFLVDGDFILTIHWDGFIVNTDSWTNDFLNYDYIGAPWPWFDNKCGNGGFCLKSKKFLEAQKDIVKNLAVNEPDDVMLSLTLREKFETHDCKYATPDVAYKFSTEHGNYQIFKSFGFHDFRIHPYFKNIVL
jgi:hypothetical protein